MLRRETIIRKGKGEDNNTKAKRMVRNLNISSRLVRGSGASAGRFDFKLGIRCILDIRWHQNGRQLL
jgi:hypothetical protein